FRFGGATAIALAGAAVVIAIGLTRPSNTTTTSESGSSAALAPGRAAGSASSPCQPQLASHVSAAPPAGYDYAQSRTDPRRPGQTLTIATVTSEAAPGADVIVFAQLTLPVPQLGAPGVAATPVETAALPCLSVDRAGATAITPGGAQ